MEIVDEWLNDRGNTHYPGCESDHIRCAVAAEIARLTAERDEAIAERRREVTRRVSAELFRDLAMLERDEARAERDEARALAVWAVYWDASIETNSAGERWVEVGHNQRRMFRFDGTDAGILDALRRGEGGE